MPALTECSGIVVTNGRTCDACGRVVAQYRNHRKPDRPKEWGHLRGTKAGTVPEHRRLLAGALIRAETAERRNGLLEEVLRDLPERLSRIETKLDEMLARPVGMWKPNHRRIADGGDAVHAQVKRRRAS